jgi:hypothetical protein
MIIWSVERQRLGKHVSATVETNATIKNVVGNGVFYADYAKVI